VILPDILTLLLLSPQILLNKDSENLQKGRVSSSKTRKLLWWRNNLIKNKTMKKVLLIVIILAIVAVGGFLAVKFLGGKLTGPMGGKSYMDIAREQGGKIPSKKEAIAECKKSEEQEDKDMCYNMVALYYRDAGLCKNIKDPEIKKGCTKEKIEEFYKSPGKGGVPTMPMMPGIPGAPEEGNDETGNTGEQETTEGPVTTGKMNDDIFVEIAARTMYCSQLYSINPTAYKGCAKKMADSYQEFGVTEKEVDSYADKLGGRVGGLMLRVNQRVAELKKTGF